MVAAATQQQQPLEQDQLKHQQPAPTAEDEALKRNTDCVYFLASPLTCKKGSECEYRHSEYARVNPRDCYYWLNGNCLNPKCGFRHPPLDGLLGTQVAAPAGASVISSQTAVPAVVQAPYGSSAPYSAAAPYNSIAPSNSSKPVVPCIFFQKGYCIKGDRCAFLHGPVPTINKAQQVTVANLPTGPPSLKKTFGTLEKCTQQQKFLPANVTKTVEVPHEPKPAPKVETVPPRNNLGNKRHAAPPSGLNEEVPRYKTSNITPVVNGSSTVHANLSHQAYMSDEQSYHTGKDIDEHLRESSPGFDVLVDDELEESEYYRGENQYGRARGHEGRNGNEYDMSRSANYDADADGDREMFRDTRGYDSYDRVQGQYDWAQRRASSERISLGSGHLERRGYSKAESPDCIGQSDLRYRLSKHRRVNGLRSAITHDHAPDNHVEERSYRGSSRRDSHHENSLSSRLRGRIKLPGRSPVNDTESLSEREMEKGRNWGRLSPGRPQISNLGRLRDRIKGRVEEEFNSKDDRIIRGGPRMRREIMDDARPNFAAPKRLAELKVVKDVENKELHVLRKRKALEDHQQSEGDLSFEGPMTLSEILKRKRQARTETSENGLSSLNKEDGDQKITKESLGGISTNAVAQSNNSSASKEETISKEESKPVIAEYVGTEGKAEVAHGESSQLPVVSDHEVEDGMIVDEGIEDELEGDEQREDGEEYYYEQGDEGDYNYEDAENLEPEEEYLDDEDGDDFAKKIGVVLS